MPKGVGGALAQAATSVGASAPTWAFLTITGTVSIIVAVITSGPRWLNARTKYLDFQLKNQKYSDQLNAKLEKKKQQQAAGKKPPKRPPS
jgi:hypothetical protein